MGPPADVYGLGCTIYAVMTGRRPFPYPSRTEILEAHKSEPAPSILTRAPHVPIPIADIIQKIAVALGMHAPGKTYERPVQ